MLLLGAVRGDSAARVEKRARDAQEHLASRR
jgi:hypothetical protein